MVVGTQQRGRWTAHLLKSWVLASASKTALNNQRELAGNGYCDLYLTIIKIWEAEAGGPLGV